MSLLQSLIWGIVSGLTEFLPVSSQAHKKILQYMFGAERQSPLLGLLVDIAVLLAVMSSCKTFIQHARKEHRRSNTHSARKTTHGSHDLRLIKHASLPLILSLICIPFISKLYNSLLLTGLGLIFNGIILLISAYTLQGNKTARTMSAIDSLLIGAGGALGVIPGISRVGCTVSAAIMRGADRLQGLNWAILLSIPTFIGLTVLDVFGLFTQPISIDFTQFLYALLSAVSAYFTTYYAIVFMRNMTAKNGYSVFAYYTFGVALFSYILYLIV